MCAMTHPNVCDMTHWDEYNEVGKETTNTTKGEKRRMTIKTTPIENSLRLELLLFRQTRKDILIRKTGCVESQRRGATDR